MEEMHTQEVCCPRFDPEPWRDAAFTWDNKLFACGQVRTLFHMPIGYGSAMRRITGAIEQAETEIADYLILSEFSAKRRMDIFAAVDREIPGLPMTRVSGRLFSAVFEGPYSQTGTWIRQFKEKTAWRGLTIGRQFFWYTTCPKCAKKYGKNYVVMIGQTE